MTNIKYTYIGFLLVCLLSNLPLPGYAYTERNLLQKEGVSKDSLAKVLNYNQNRFGYPGYEDRAGWDKLFGKRKSYYIQSGEEMLNYQWQLITATEYLEYQRTGSRDAMQVPYGENNDALSRLVFAELAEGKGRFIDQIINGVFQYCQMTSWAVSAHLNMQKQEKILPDYRENIIDLQVADVGAFLSWTYYFLHDEFDKVNPIISKYLQSEIKRRVLDVYMQNPAPGWSALNGKPNMVNNWNTWCNSNVLQCFLLMEDDKNRLADEVWQTMQSVDQFINYNKEDGACDEGPSYWGLAAGKMFDYLDLLYIVTDGKISIFDKPIIKNLAEYISNSYAGNGWTVNFADASAKSSADSQLWFRYGKAVNSQEMMHLAALLYNPDIYPLKSNKRQTADTFRGLQALKIEPEILACKPEHIFKPYVAYPESGMCFMSNTNNWFLAAKGGNNGESHNHNDVGTFSLYMNGVPVFIDTGVGTYTRKTFGPERYTIWNMRSDYHNVPEINGILQKDGKSFKAKDLVFEKKNKFFSIDISSAYPQESKTSEWIRAYKLEKNKLKITDSFVMENPTKNNRINFMVCVEPDIQTSGKIKLTISGKTVLLEYNPKQLQPSVETVTLDDPKFSTVWGDKIYRITLTAKDLSKKATYSYVISN